MEKNTKCPETTHRVPMCVLARELLPGAIKFVKHSSHQQFTCHCKIQDDIVTFLQLSSFQPFSITFFVCTL